MSAPYYAEGDHEHQAWLEVDGHTYNVLTPGGHSTAVSGEIRMDWTTDSLLLGWELDADQAAAIILGMLAARKHGMAMGEHNLATKLRNLLGAGSDYVLSDLEERVSEIEER